VSAEFDVDGYIAEEYEAEIAADLAFEMQLAIRCVISVLAVVLLVVVRQMWLV